MKKTIITLILILILNPIIKSQDIKEYYFKFDLQDKKELEKITSIISIDNVKENTVYAYALQHELEAFKKLGYKIEYIPKDIPKSLTMATTIEQMENWDRYPTYEVYRELMNNFEASYPDICKLDSIGTTHDGRKLYVLKISDNVLIEEKEPEFFYTSTMHGDETTGYILLLRLADSLLSSYGSVSELTNLINSTEIFINPNANPDGTYAGGNNTVSGATRSNGYADLNRDFPDPRTGTNAPYQPETQAMMNFAEEHNIVMAANFHGGEDVLNYPWDTWYLSENRHADTEWYERVCTDYVTTAKSVNPNYYTGITGDTDGVTHGATWYKIDGGRQDYMNYWHQCRETTIELSVSKLLAVESLNSYWNYNKQSLIDFIQECHYGVNGTVKSINQEPLNAMLWFDGHDEINDSSMVFTDADHGNYYRLIEPGTYDIIASSYSYITDTIKNISVTDYASRLVNFELQKDITYNLIGKITDASNGNNIENASVSVKNIPVEISNTNNDGEYSINNVTEGTFEIVIFKEGFNRLTEEITISSEDTIFNFSLFPIELEDFETNDFTKYNWVFSGNADWIIDNSIAYEGTSSARSGDISDGNNSAISLNVNIKNTGIISFYKKVSSEANYDFLRFYVDDTEIAKWSGEYDWSLFEYEIESGEHNLKWMYTKDGNTSHGSDCGWIDYITIPGFDNESDSINLAFNYAIIQDSLFLGEQTEYELIFSNESNASSSFYSVSIEDFENNHWVSINKTNGNLIENNKDTVKINLSANELNEFDHVNTNIIIISQDLDIYTIPINLYIKPKLKLNPLSIKDTLNIGDNSINYLEIENSSDETFSYIVELNQNEEWISLDKTEGAIDPHGKDTIEVHLDATDQIVGVKNCTISISKNDYSETYICPVELLVKDPSSVQKIDQLKDLKIYPNPFNEYLKIEFYSDNSDVHYITVYNLSGVKLYEMKYTPIANNMNSLTLDLSMINNFVDGMYFLQIKSNDFNISSRIIKD